MYDLAVVGCLIGLLCGCDQIQAVVQAAAQQQAQRAESPTTEDKTFGPDNYAAECEKRQKTAEADLCQQWRMANAAAQQLAVLTEQLDVQREQLGLQRLEMLLLFGTLAGSIGAVWVAVRTSRAELRAYVFVKHADRHDPVIQKDRKTLMFFDIENTGSTPAFRVRHVTYSGVFHDPALIPAIDRKKMSKGMELGPHDRVQIQIPFGPFSPETVERFKAGQDVVYFFGEVCYRDTFRRNRYTRYRFSLPIDKDGGYQNLKLEPEGNKAT